MHFLTLDGVKKWTSIFLLSSPRPRFLSRFARILLLSTECTSNPSFSSTRTRGCICVNETITFRIYGYHKCTDRARSSDNRTNINYFMLTIYAPCRTCRYRCCPEETNCQFVRESLDLPYVCIYLRRICSARLIKCAITCPRIMRLVHRIDFQHECIKQDICRDCVTFAIRNERKVNGAITNKRESHKFSFFFSKATFRN